jgi:hypothetical protein
MILVSFHGFSQQIVQGQVVDHSTREPLELSLVRETSSGHSTLTDKSGKFRLAGSQEHSDTLSLFVTYIGYKSRLVKIVRDLPNPVVIELDRGILEMKEVVVTNTGSINPFQILHRIDLNFQPIESAQDLLRQVPGLFIAQHQGGGKAEQIFLRGFDADHGTDVSVSVDDMPVNLVSHAHGQGYSDLHFLIPETVSGYDFGKGPYYANRGDFETAGYVSYHTINAPDGNLIKIEAGQFGTGRVVGIVNLIHGKSGTNQQRAYVAGEALYTNGPFDNPEHFSRFNLFGKYITPLWVNHSLILSFSGLSSGWHAAGEIPNRALAEGYIKDRFGEIDSSQGGFTSRISAGLKLSSAFKNDINLENHLYYSRYFFNLVSDFTFFYFYPQSGDQFTQHESRNLFGYMGKLSRQNSLADGILSSCTGWGIRYDQIDPSYLAHSANGSFILNYIQLGSIREKNLYTYLDESYKSGNWLAEGGLRLDYLQFEYINKEPSSNSSAAVYQRVAPSVFRMIASPKINITYSANPKVQLYAKAGKGFHSNDARVVIAGKGNGILPAAYGVDLGVNLKPLPGLFINAAIWSLYLQQEFTYGADLGDQVVTPGGKTRRIGMDASFRYQFNEYFFGYLNLDLARPREVGGPKGKNYLPLAPTFTSTGGLNLKLQNGISGSLGYRYMHDRPANPDYSLTALGYWVADLAFNYTRKNFEIGISIENLFNQTWNESQFEYSSKLRYETSPVDEVSYTPGVPFFAKLKFSVFF